MNLRPVLSAERAQQLPASAGQGPEVPRGPGKGSGLPAPASSLSYIRSHSVSSTEGWTNRQLPGLPQGSPRAPPTPSGKPVCARVRAPPAAASPTPRELPCPGARGGAVTHPHALAAGRHVSWVILSGAAASLRGLLSASVSPAGGPGCTLGSDRDLRPGAHAGLSRGEGAPPSPQQDTAAVLANTCDGKLRPSWPTRWSEGSSLINSRSFICCQGPPL